MHSFHSIFTNKLITIQTLLDSATQNLFCKTKAFNHCLYPMLPPDKTLHQVLRTRAIRSSYPHVALIFIKILCHQLSFTVFNMRVFLFLCLFYFVFLVISFITFNVCALLLVYLLMYSRLANVIQYR